MEKETRDYRHLPPDESPQEPDAKPGNYYVTCRNDAGKHAALLGPFKDDHAGALAMVGPARRKAEELDPWASFFAFGTCRTDYSFNKPGRLNKYFDLNAEEEKK